MNPLAYAGLTAPMKGDGGDDGFAGVFVNVEDAAHIVEGGFDGADGAAEAEFAIDSGEDAADVDADGATCPTDGARLPSAVGIVLAVAGELLAAAGRSLLAWPCS